MRKGCLSDKDLVINIIANTMNKNRGVNWFLRTPSKKNLINLARFAFYLSYYKGGVFISSDNKGIALCYKYNTPSKSIIPLIQELIFIISSIKLRYIPEILKLEHYKRNQRPTDGEYYYFWFFSALKESDNAGFELKNEIYKKAADENLPIYAETTEKRNKLVYERLGFKSYHYYENEKRDLQIWFMHKYP